MNCFESGSVDFVACLQLDVRKPNFLNYLGFLGAVYGEATKSTRWRADR